MHFGGSGMSCLSEPASEKHASEHHDTRALDYALSTAVENDNHAAVENLLQNNPGRGPKNSWQFSRAKNVRMAELFKRAGFSRFAGRDGYELLEKAVQSHEHDVALIAWYISNGADPNYIVLDDYDSSLPYALREGYSQRTVMNMLWHIADQLGIACYIPSVRVAFIAKARALVQAGASLSASNYDSNSGYYGVELKPIAYRMNIPWQLKRFLFMQCSSRQNNSRVQFFLDLRSTLMKAWNERVSTDKTTLAKQKALENVFMPIGLKDLCGVITQYAVDTYQDFENQEYYGADDKGVQGRLLSAPEGDYKPCVHNDDSTHSVKSQPCTGPCKEVFEAFGMQKPDPEKYKALKNSRFADRDEIPKDCWSSCAQLLERVNGPKRISFVRRFNLEE